MHKVGRNFGQCAVVQVELLEFGQFGHLGPLQLGAHLGTAVADGQLLDGVGRRRAQQVGQGNLAVRDVRGHQGVQCELKMVRIFGCFLKTSV